VDIQSINPATGKVIAEFPSANQSDVIEALARTRSCQRKWYKETSRDDRATCIRQLGKILVREKDNIANLVHEECGFPRNAVLGEVNSALAGVEHYIREYSRFEDEAFPLDATWIDTKATIHYVPHGVIGHIGIWNFPIWQTMITAIPGLLTGNGLVFKPSELSTMSGLKVAEMVHEAGFPKDLFVPLIGGADVGRSMVRSGFDALVFTGGIETGQEIARNAGIRPMILELSGNDAGIVCSDADIETAARGVCAGTFGRAGQICIRIKRVYVHEDVAIQFIRRVVEIASHIDVKASVGPLIRERARSDVDRVVKSAVSDGAKLLLGGKKIEGPGYFYEPTVLLVERDDLEVTRKETFGPVCPINIVENEDLAVQKANDTGYGLGATIWTKDQSKALRMASSLEAGNVWINDCGRSLTCGEFFQGWKQSGIASSQRRIQMFLKKKAVINHQKCEARPNWFK
jgi:succinate-semialdehyde dehydrogenase/glutarate-semialdehyde dehydrogenase/succinyl-CoA reductase